MGENVPEFWVIVLQIIYEGGLNEKSKNHSRTYFSAANRTAYQEWLEDTFRCLQPLEVVLQLFAGSRILATLWLEWKRARQTLRGELS